jgi:P4 family phage/plasmid primase-like protien
MRSHHNRGGGARNEWNGSSEIPPHSPDAERSALAAIFDAEGENQRVMLAALKREFFHVVSCRATYDAMSSLARATKPISVESALSVVNRRECGPADLGAVMATGTSQPFAAVVQQLSALARQRAEFDGRSGRSPVTPSQWFAERFPVLAGEYGDAILEEKNKGGIVSARDIGEDYLAATLGDLGSAEAPTVFLPTEEKFYTYASEDGVFLQQREPILLARLSRLLLDCARDCKQSGCDTKALEFRFRDSANLSGVLRKARGILHVPDTFFSSDLTEYIPCANGMLRLRDREPLPFSQEYRRRNKLAVPFDAQAKCPMFLETLIQPALEPDDLDFLQRWCGLALIGENLAQKIVILTGTAGGGKGTFVRVLNGIIGQMNLASLRPQLLGERFEMGRFLGKTLLYGPDVAEDFLNHRGASVLKSLTGYDPVTLEFKNSNESPSMICRFNIIVTCNSRLTVRLEGDTDAWRRRLCIVDYHKPKPERLIADLDRQILEREGSGVLNWMLEGLDKLRANGWQLHLTSDQQAAVDNLLLESDGHTLFAREALVRADGGQLAVTDCFAAYVAFCNERGWNAITRKKFGDVIGDTVVRAFGLTTRHDIRDSNGKAQRGWYGLALREKFPGPSGKSPSEASENGFSDGADGHFPLQATKIADPISTTPEQKFSQPTEKTPSGASEQEISYV